MQAILLALRDARLRATGGARWTPPGVHRGHCQECVSEKPVDKNGDFVWLFQCGHVYHRRGFNGEPECFKIARDKTDLVHSTPNYYHYWCCPECHKTRGHAVNGIGHSQGCESQDSKFTDFLRKGTPEDRRSWCSDCTMEVNERTWRGNPLAIQQVAGTMFPCGHVFHDQCLHKKKWDFSSPCPFGCV